MSRIAAVVRFVAACLVGAATGRVAADGARFVAAIAFRDVLPFSFRDGSRFASSGIRMMLAKASKPSGLLLATALASSDSDNSRSALSSSRAPHPPAMNPASAAAGNQ